MEQKIFKNEGQRRYAYLVFGIYLLLLCWLVLFKFAVRPSEIPRMRGLNLIPFHYGMETPFHRTEILYNVLVFVPAGVYFTAFLKDKKKGFRGAGILVTMVLSLLFETIQWIFAIGASDITDVITNTAGGAFGCLFFLGLGKLFPKNRMKVINVAGTVIEVLGIVMLSILLIANE